MYIMLRKYPYHHQGIGKTFDQVPHKGLMGNIFSMTLLNMSPDGWHVFLTTKHRMQTLKTNVRTKSMQDLKCNMTQFSILFILKIHPSFMNISNTGDYRCLQMIIYSVIRTNNDTTIRQNTAAKWKIGKCHSIEIIKINVT